jgi:hypothetical protein
VSIVMSALFQNFVSLQINLLYGFVIQSDGKI